MHGEVFALWVDAQAAADGGQDTACWCAFDPDEGAVEDDGDGQIVTGDDAGVPFVPLCGASLFDAPPATPRTFNWSEFLWVAVGCDEP